MKGDWPLRLFNSRRVITLRKVNHVWCKWVLSISYGYYFYSEGTFWYVSSSALLLRQPIKFVVNCRHKLCRTYKDLRIDQSVVEMLQWFDGLTGKHKYSPILVTSENNLLNFRIQIVCSNCVQMNYVVYEVSLICSDSHVYSILANNRGVLRFPRKMKRTKTM